MRIFIAVLFFCMSGLVSAAQFCFNIAFSTGYCTADECYVTGNHRRECVNVPDNQYAIPQVPSFSGHYSSGGGGGGGGVQPVPVNSLADESTCAPVHIQSGLKHFTDTDYSSPDEFGLFLVRSYSSFPVPVFVRSERRGLFGTSWSTNFDERLSIKYSDNTICERGRRNACSVSKVPDVITYRDFNAGFSFKRVHPNVNLYYPVTSTDEYRAPYASMEVNQQNGDIALKKKDGSTSIYDVYGSLKKVTSINGIEWNYTYNSNYQLYRVTHSNGKYLQFSWNSNGVVDKVLLPNGKLINYTYNNFDSSYVLNEIIYPESAGIIKYVTEYQAGSGSFLIKEKHIDGKKWGEYEYAWNSAKQHAVVTSSGYVGGVEKSTFQYDTNITRVTNAKGATAVYNYDRSTSAI